MNRFLFLASVVLSAAWPATAALYDFSFNSGFENSGNIPDGNVNPWSDTRGIGGIAETSIASVRVRVEIAGGYNGDLYGYLSYNTVLVPLVNRVGVGTGNAFGYDNAGFSVTFSDAASENFHFYQTVSGWDITGGAAWKPDGRAISPLSSPEAFDAPGTVTLASFGGMNPNGNWTLVFADVSKGGGQAAVMSWGLEIEAVPEPVNVALGVFAGLAAVACGARWWRQRGRQPGNAP